jgi:hypothetical protein
MTKKIIVGIDPDVNKSGFATYCNGELLVEALAFPALIEKLYILATLPEDVLVVVEAGWLNEKSNFRNISDKRSDAISKKVGRNQQTGILICEMAEYYGLEVIRQMPFDKCWSGPDRKITHDELNYILKRNNIKELKSSNQEKRDAALICAVHADLKLKVKV